VPVMQIRHVSCNAETDFLNIVWRKFMFQSADVTILVQETNKSSRNEINL
jgi:hypothetical protein